MELNNSKVRYGQEHGKNLIKIAKNLLKNENLCMLLKNTDLDPLNKNTHPEQINGDKLLHELIKVIPFLDSNDQTTTSKVVILFDEGTPNSTNADNENIVMDITIYCPFKSWIITGNTIRPFAIMSEIRKSLQNKRINGLGEIRYDGFNLSTLTEEMGVYNMRFFINAFN